MSATAISSSIPRDDFPGARASTPGVPLKAERLLALGDSHRPNIKRASSVEGSRLIALLTARKELRNTVDRTSNDELVKTSDWIIDDLFEPTTPDIWSFTPSPSTTASKPGVLRKQPPQSQRKYYDPSTVPLRVSQQTSASAMRDMGLHKQAAILGQPVPDARARSSTMEPDSRRHKLDKLLGATDYPSSSNAKLDITSYFTTPRPPTTISSDPLRNNSLFTTSSEHSLNAPPSLSELPKRPLPSRAGVSGLQISAPQLTAFNSTVNLRPLPRAEEDVLQNAKMHRHRPPKGASNWFDGLDVSSDDEDFDDDALDGLSYSQGPPNEHHTNQRMAKRMSKRMSRLEDQFARNAREPHHARSSTQAASSGQHPSLRSSQSLADLQAESQTHSSRAVPSTQPTDDSVFSLTSLDDLDVDLLSDPETGPTTIDGVHYGEAAHVDISKVRAKRLSHRPSLQRDPLARNGSTNTNVTSGTIPVRLASDVHVPQRPGASSRYSSAAHIAPHLLASEVPTTPAQPRSSCSSDAPHIMEVTEEEMALLEMMRQKRATMAKNHPSDSRAPPITPRQSKELSSASRAATLKLFPSNYGQDLDDFGALPQPRREYHNGLMRADDALSPRSTTPHESRARAKPVSGVSSRSVSEGQRPATAYANANDLVAPRPLSPRSARRTQDVNSHKRSFTQQATAPPLDRDIPIIPHRNPDRMSLTQPSSTAVSSDNDDSDSNHAGGIAVAPTPIDDVRQSICSTLPDTAPLSLPTLSSAVYRPHQEEKTPNGSYSSKSSAARPSPRVILTNTLNKSSQPPGFAQQGRSITAPPEARAFSTFRDSLPLNTGPVMRKPSDPSIYETVRLNPLCMNPPMEFVESSTSSSTASRFSPFPRSASSSMNPEHGLTHSPSAATVSPDTPDTPVGPRTTLGLQPSQKPRQLAKSPTIESIRQSAEDSVGKRGSMVSMTSVGEDVLAAWAELGGGTLHFRF